MVNAYTREFIEDYEPYDDLHKTDREVKEVKRSLKARGFQVVRSKWLSSLGYYQVRAIRYKHGKPDMERLAFMKSWATPC